MSDSHTVQALWCLYPPSRKGIGQGRTNKCGGPDPKKIVGPTRTIKMKDQMTVFCSFFQILKIENASRPDKDILV